VESITERLSLYTRLDNSNTEEELVNFENELQDRFGPVPKQVGDLFETVRCRQIAVELGFERLMLKDETLRCYFINNPASPYFESDTFRAILNFIQKGTNKARLKQNGKLFMLIVDNMKTMEQILKFLREMKIFVTRNY
jgi:transcription-repair coupling factor (superfamily II helicase)